MSYVNLGVDVRVVCVEALELGYSRNYEKGQWGLGKCAKVGSMRGRQDYGGPYKLQQGVWALF